MRSDRQHILMLTVFHNHVLTEVSVSPTKPCGKGSKRKQDELDDDDEDEDEEEEHQTWVEALTQELADDDGPEEDPDYEVGAERGPVPGGVYVLVDAVLRLIPFQPSSVETASEEYCSHNNTESDIEVHGKGVVVIEDVNTVRCVMTPDDLICGMMR